MKLLCTCLSMMKNIITNCDVSWLNLELLWEIHACMRGQDGQLKLRLEDRLNLWKDYCEEVLNIENPWVCGLEM